MAVGRGKVSTTAAKKKPTARRPRGVSLHIGLNAVDPAHYGGWSGPLAACEFDAHDMAAIAEARGFADRALLLGAAATRDAVLAGLRGAARTLREGDLFFLSFSGHGGQVADASGDEDDKQDETWCLHDGQLIDDELYAALSRFGAGVRVLVLSDSCHSGTVTRGRAPAAAPGARSRLMPREVALRTYEQHRGFYDGLQRDLAQSAGAAALADPDAVLAGLALQSPRVQAIARRFEAAAVLIAACQDNQTALDGDHNGLFTGQLRAVWNGGRFEGSHAALHARVAATMPPAQSPKLTALGAAGAFVAQRPFTV